MGVNPRHMLNAGPCPSGGWQICGAPGTHASTSTVMRSFDAIQSFNAGAVFTFPS